MIEAQWHGTEEERRDLGEAIWRNCTCCWEERTLSGAVCSAHGMLGSQRVLDHLLAMRRLRQRLIEEEFSAARERA
jgi:hypothetical protein